MESLLVGVTVSPPLCPGMRQQLPGQHGVRACVHVCTGIYVCVPTPLSPSKPQVRTTFMLAGVGDAASM